MQELENIEDILVRRDGLTMEEAKEHVNSVRDQLASGELDMMSIDDILQDEFGLEPDYMFQLIDI